MAQGAGGSAGEGDIIAEVETDKGAIEIEVFTSGTLSKILVEPGQKGRSGRRSR